VGAGQGQIPHGSVSQVVDDHDFVAGIKQGVGQMGADESGPTGHKDS